MLLFLACIVKIIVCCLATDCPDEWLAYEGSCYLFGADTVHFIEAEHYCRQHNAHLVHVGSNEENSFLKGYISSIFQGSNNYWLGMTDELIEGVWSWIDNNGRLEYQDWGASEPNNYGGKQDCAVLYRAFQYKWADIECTSNNRALCEKGAGTTPDVVG